jgi:hypothetical protein
LLLVLTSKNLSNPLVTCCPKTAPPYPKKSATIEFSSVQVPPGVVCPIMPVDIAFIATNITSVELVLVLVGV